MAEPERRCRILTRDARSSCTACGDTWSADDRHICPDARVIGPAPLPLAASARRVLVAMVTRGMPLIDGPAGPFVRGWGGDVARRDRDRLLTRGLVVRDDRMRHVLLATDEGRRVALEACTPETRERLSA